MSKENPVALVTDAASFIGPALTSLYLSEKVKIVAADPSFADDKAASAFQIEFPGVFTIAQTSPADTAERAKEHSATFDILCTGGAYPAGKTPASGLTVAATTPFFEKLVIEPLAYLAEVVEDMKAQGYGRVAFITSAGPLGGIPNYTAYASARAALNGSVKSLAVELASSGISVNAVAPNFIATEAYFPKALIEDPAISAKILSRVPAKRFGEPEEAAQSVAFFTLVHSQFVTGQVLSISGGWA